MSGEIFSDDSMLEIFRAEVETHVEALTSGLLALERDPNDTSHLDEMMRGAHSIKGAARIVGIDPAVRVAHVMEDGFIAAQNGRVILRPEHVDVLLRGVDILNRIAKCTNVPAVDWGQFDAETTQLVGEIAAVLSGNVAKPATAIRASEPWATDGAASSVASTKSLSSTNETTISIPEMLDASAAERVRQAVVAAWEARIAKIRLDLTVTCDLDTTGLALLASIPAQSVQTGSAVELIGVTPDLQTVLDATGVGRLYPSGGP